MAGKKRQKTGLLSGVDFEEYLGWRYLTRGVVSKVVWESPYHAWWEQNNCGEESAALRFGTLVHAAILEPDTLEERFVAGPDVRGNSNAWKEFVESCPGKVVVKQKEWADALEMRDAVLRLPEFRVIQKHGQFEVSCVWRERGIGLAKGRLDAWVPVENGINVDLKTTSALDAAAFERALWDYGYYVQGAWYRRGVRAATKGGYAPSLYSVALGKSRPYCPVIYRVSDDALKAGDRVIEIGLARYRRCLDKGEWPRPSGVREIDLPLWAYERIENIIY